MISWWQALLAAAVCTWAGWMGAMRWRLPAVVIVAQQPIPMEKLTLQNVHEGDPFVCTRCHQPGHVAMLTRPVVNLTCGSCGHTAAVRD